MDSAVVVVVVVVDVVDVDVVVVTVDLPMGANPPKASDDVKQRAISTQRFILIIIVVGGVGWGGVANCSCKLWD